MTHAATLTVWVALGIVGYVCVGYPLLLWLFARFRRLEVKKADIAPNVTLLISAFNEAKAIREKLENTLSLDYPPDCLEVIVISDASNDGTDRIVESFSGSGIRLIRLPSRSGKTAGLNAAMEVARGEVVVFSDANILYERSAIRSLVANFADPAVGCVTGDSCYVESKPSSAHCHENAYWSYERFLRTMESQIGSTVGGDGAIFAIRRVLYTLLRPEAINDLVTPLQIVARGYRAVYEPRALGYEPSPGSFRAEFRRKRRIVSRSWCGVMQVREVLRPWRMGLFSWQVWSHKVLRWLLLPVMVTGGVGCFIAYSDGVVYQIGGWAFVSSLVLASLGAFFRKRSEFAAKVVQGLFYFYMVNLAAFVGTVTALRGRAEMVWVPERQ